MPKQGQTVESCLIAGWKKTVGDPVATGEIVCEVETDKALVEIESPAAGVLLEIFFKVGDDVPVLTNIAVIGQPGEDVSSLRPAGAIALAPVPAAASAPKVETVPAAAPAVLKTTAVSPVGISPRARNLAKAEGLDAAGLSGSGPGGRIIERDVRVALAAAHPPAITPLAKTMLAQGGFTSPMQGTGISGRIMAADLTPAVAQAEAIAAGRPLTAEVPDEVTVIPVKGIRRVIADRMLESLQTTAQLTLNASADARSLLAYRQQLKTSPEALGLQKITINDLILLAVSRTLSGFSGLNALFNGEAISQYQNVHLAVAVDTPRGLMVPVIRRANTLNLKQIAQEARRLVVACQENKISPDELNGGTFTVTNLGAFGVESFTPVLNPPQVAILGVGNINLKPVEVAGEVQFIPHLGLSLTINHQVVDGAPAARFLQALAQGLAQIELLLAL
jgi:pyruvate dehydrogenase E2 component (dihydrolipoamide acetyltransferase)